MKRSKWMFITKRYSHLLVILAFFDFGCAHTHQISQQSPVNFGSKKVRIVLMNSSERIAAHHVQVASDSVSYINTKTKMKRSVATTEVDKIITVNHGKGAAEGLGVGLLTGLAMVGVSAALIAGAEWDGDGPHPLTFVVLAALAGAGFTGVSTIIGAAAGSRDIYVFDEKEDEKTQ